YNIIRSLMACVELSLEWYIDSFEELYLKRGIVNKNHKYLNKLYLKKIYYEFIIYLQHFTKIMNKIDSILLTKRSFSKEKRFDNVCEVFGREIFSEFEFFLMRHKEKIINDYKGRYSNYKKENFSVKRSSLENNFIQEIINTAEKIFTNTCDRNSLSYMSKVIGEINHTNLKLKNDGGGYGYYHIFNFFGYLKKNNVSHSIDKDKLYKYIQNYCFENNMEPGYKLVSALEDVFYGSLPIFKQLVELVNRSQVTKFNYRSYSQAFCNCIILCENQDDYKKVLLKKKLWRKLNTVTSYDMNIYYCDLDEKGKLLGYDVRNSLKKEGNFKISKSNIPCLLLWQDDINEYELVELKKITINSYFFVIKELVSIIDDYNVIEAHSMSKMEREYLFIQAVTKARKVVDNILEDSGGISVKIGKIIGGNIGIIGKGKIEDSQFVNIEKDTNILESEIDLQKLRDELAALEEYLRKKEAKTDKEKILLSDILDLQQIAGTEEVEEIEASIKSKASDLFKNIASGVGAGIIANILSKVMGI
ncbi:hypothetical protein ACFCVQ_30135, partial [Bacillus thuringiensis]|uniref:hypothetical protein n=1 Tax=Bacillus thuringiensis TaxID=1428 RepID=UPI0035D7A941